MEEWGCFQQGEENCLKVACEEGTIRNLVLNMPSFRDLKCKWECQVHSYCVNLEFRITAWTRAVYQESKTHGGYLKPRDWKGPVSKKNTGKRC